MDKKYKDWIRDNEWMVYYWVLHAKEDLSEKRMQHFNDKCTIELNEANARMVSNDPASAYKKQMYNLFLHIVFGSERSGLCFSIEGFHTKYKRFPKKENIQLYFSRFTHERKDDGGDTCLDTIDARYRWEFKD